MNLPCSFDFISFTYRRKGSYYLLLLPRKTQKNYIKNKFLFLRLDEQPTTSFYIRPLRKCNRPGVWYRRLATSKVECVRVAHWVQGSTIGYLDPENGWDLRKFSHTVGSL